MTENEETEEPTLASYIFAYIIVILWNVFPILFYQILSRNAENLEKSDI